MKPILWMLIAVFGLAVSAAHAAEKPNIVLILADDLGYGDLSCYGQKRWATPNLDRMAVEGVRFTDFYVPMPFCAPSRAALLTGRYPFRSGMVFNPAPDNGVDDLGLPDSELTLAQVLKNVGYATLCIGKWHLGHKPQFYPTRRGFDHYYGILYSNDMRPVRIMEDDRVAQYPVVQATLTQQYTHKALRFIEAHREQPFFLYLPHAMPHKPLAASDSFYKTTPGGLYADVMSELDWSVGQILAKLKELKLDEKTLVIFTSDNGPWFGGSTGGLRGMKGRPWEGGVRVPMIARWPGRIAAGHTCREPAGIIDLFPTVAHLAGVNVPAKIVLDGQDLWPLMTTQGAPGPHEALFFMSGARLAAVRSGRWKLFVPNPGPPFFTPPGKPWDDPRSPDGVTIIAPFEQYGPDSHPGLTDGDAPREMMLFDLEGDPAEQHNVAEQNPQVVQKLKAMFEQMNRQVPAFTPPKYGPTQVPGPRPKPG